MLDTATALKKMQRLKDDSRTMRAHNDAFWQLAMVYGYGPQWGHINRSTGNINVKFLRPLTDPQRTDLRVAINQIQPAIDRMHASMAPERIGFNLVPRSVGDHEYAVGGKQLLNAHLLDINALPILRENELDAMVLGTAIIRRTLTMRPAPAGVGRAIVKDFKASWSRVQPHEILRDPSANTVRPQDNESIFCHEKPQTLDWLLRIFKVRPETSTPMGQLMSFQRTMQSATGLSTASGVADSKEPAVLVYECYFQDPDMPGDWPWLMIAYQTAGEGKSALVAIGELRPNPFYGLPFHIFPWVEQPQSPWGLGLPHVAMKGQDVFNVSLTWLVRIMQEGSGRWMVPKGSIERTQMSQVLSTDIRQPLIYQPAASGAKPERTAPPVPNPAGLSILAQAPEWMKQSMGIQDAQFGKPAGKRGESGQAFTARLNEANATLGLRQTTHELILSELLMGTLADIVNTRHSHLGRARKLLGKDANDELTRSLFRRPAEDAIKTITIQPSTVRPLTLDEQQNKYVSLVGAKLMEAAEAQWEMMLRNVDISTDMKNQYDKQVMEIDQLVTGKSATVELFENHELAIRTIEWYMNRPETLALDDEGREAINAHAVQHFEAKVTRAQGESMISQLGEEPPGQEPGQGSAPGQAVTSAATATGPAQPVGV